jgi:hypothetical protein
VLPRVYVIHECERHARYLPFFVTTKTKTKAKTKTKHGRRHHRARRGRHKAEGLAQTQAAGSAAQRYIERINE